MAFVASRSRSFYQIVSSFLRSLDVPWPHVFQSLMAKMGIINLNLLQLPKSACLHPQPSFYKQFLGCVATTRVQDDC